MQEFDETVTTPAQEESKSTTEVEPATAQTAKPVESTPQKSPAPSTAIPKQTLGPKQSDPTPSPSATIITGKSGKNKKKQKGMGGKK
jgi:hypothetical protein